MSELIFLKLGGSLITDKSREATARLDVIQRLAGEVKAALQARSDLQLLIGHGSGSFGHILAHRYHVHTGCSDWWGYAETGAVAARLNRLVTDTFLAAGVPVISLQPSASAHCRSGELLTMAVEPIRQALAHGLIPLVYGDVAFDEAQGSAIISTEQIFVFLAHFLMPQRIVLAGSVGGVFTSDPQRDIKAALIPEISVRRLSEFRDMLAGSYDVDVTGGMLSKIMAMCQLVQQKPDLTVHLISGMQPGDVREALENPDFRGGTLLCW